MKNHLKRIATPRTWVINRAKNTFIVRPNPGAHSLEMGLPLGIILRDKLHLASTMNEVKKILNNNHIMVDGKRRKDHRFTLGLFDILSIPTLKKNYVTALDSKGNIVVREITESEAGMKIVKIVGKTILPKGIVQYNLHDGKNIVSDTKAKVGDCFMLSLPKLEIKETFPLKEGMTVLLTSGKHAGSIGSLKELKGTEATYLVDDKEVATVRRHLFVIGDKKVRVALGAST